jgi:hypothetical protein
MPSKYCATKIFILGHIIVNEYLFETSKKGAVTRTKIPQMVTDTDWNKINKVDLSIYSV